VKLTDDDIAGAVRRALQRDPRVKSFSVDVLVEDRTVTLRGQVGYAAARRAAVQDTRNTVGVVDVQDELTVRSPAIVGDQDLAQHVRAALARDPIVDQYKLAVAAQGRTVYLRGTVATWVEKARAEDIVERIDGVEKIQNELVVNDAARQ
jgi:osmotically-inducible protein OsmY